MVVFVIVKNVLASILFITSSPNHFFLVLDLVVVFPLIIIITRFLKSATKAEDFMSKISIDGRSWIVSSAISLVRRVKLNRWMD